MTDQFSCFLSVAMAGAMFSSFAVSFFQYFILVFSHPQSLGLWTPEAAADLDLVHHQHPVHQKPNAEAMCDLW